MLVWRVMAFSTVEPVEQKTAEPQPIDTGFVHETEMFLGHQTDREHNTVDITTRLVVAVLDLAGKLGEKASQGVIIADSPFAQRHSYEITAQEKRYPNSGCSRLVDMRISGHRLKGVSNVQAEYTKTHTNKYRVLSYFASYEEGDNGPLTVLKRHYESPVTVAVFYESTWYGAFWDPFGGTIQLRAITSEDDWEQYRYDFANFRAQLVTDGILEKAEDLT